MDSSSCWRLVSTISFLFATSIRAHPQCLDFSAPTTANQKALTFCLNVKSNLNTAGSCCSATRESQIKASFDTLNLSATCKSYHSQVVCGECEPYALHLMGESTPPSLQMCPDFCDKYYKACATELSLPSSYCASHSPKGFYCFPYVPPAEDPNTQLKPYFQKVAMPKQMVGMYKRPDYNAWWILSQDGKIRQVLNDPLTTSTKLILDLTAKAGSVYPDVETGLLGLAFRPDFGTSRIFFVNYVTPSLKTTIAMYKYDMNSTAATLATEKIVLQIQQPFKNHNGGMILFSPADIAKKSGATSYDLYITSGDGGDINDPGNRAQNLAVPFGKILRIRVPTASGGALYTLPPDNLSGMVYAYGMRNPWRCTFDKDKITTPELWCGDVGQEKMEEVHKIVKGGDHGWRHHEGTLCNADTTPCNPFVGNPGVKPEFQFCHSFSSDPICPSIPFTGLSITGGYIYRGSKYPQFKGDYIFSDYMSPSQLYRIKYNATTNKWEGAVILGPGKMVRATAFAEDPTSGELYIVAYNKDGSQSIYELPCGDLCLKVAGTGDPTCANGKIHANGVTCCDIKCQACGGSSCSTYTGGAANCCASNISASGRLCSNVPAPCTIT